MLDKWFEAFSKWPSGNQVIFSGIMLICGMLLMVLFGLWINTFIYHLSILFRGWPPDAQKKPEPSVNGIAPTRVINRMNK